MHKAFQILTLIAFIGTNRVYGSKLLFACVVITLGLYGIKSRERAKLLKLFLFTVKNTAAFVFFSNSH